MATIKDSVELFEDEVIVREYHAIDKEYVPVLSSGAEGRIAITNRRVIGRSELSVAGGKRVELNTVPLETVQGTCLSSGYSISWLFLIPGIGLLIYGIFGLISRQWGLGVILLIAGIILIVFSFRREVKIGVRAASIVHHGHISRAEPEGYLLLSQSGFRAYRIHGPDIEAVMRSLDAVILTVQQRGLEVIKDLKCSNPECSYMTMIGEEPPKHCPECGRAWRSK